MYIVTLGNLPPLRYDTIEEAWSCRYLDGRRGCMCLCSRDCRCKAFERFKRELENHGVLRLHAATVYIEGVTHQ